MRHLIHSIQVGTSTKGFTWQNGLVLYKGRFFLGPHCPLSHKYSIWFTAALLLAILVSLNHNIEQKREFFWHGMKVDIKKFVKECDVPQRIKSKTSVPAGLLHPLQIPTTPWTDVSLDFIEGLPKSQGFEVILVVVDKLTSMFILFLSLTLISLLKLLPCIYITI